MKARHEEGSMPAAGSQPPDVSSVVRPAPGRFTEAWLALGALGATLVFFRDVVAGGVLYSVDFSQTFVPLHHLLRRSFAEGLPLWSGGLSNGMPLVANPINLAFYPPNLLFAFVSDIPRWLTILTVAHIFWAMLGAIRLARHFGYRPSAAFATGTIFAFSGIVISATSPVAHLFTLVWLPWLLLVSEKIADSPPAKAAAWGVVRLALVMAVMFTAGEPFVIAAGVAGIALLRLPAIRRDGIRATIGVLVRLAAGLGGGFVLSFPAILPGLLFLPSSVRGIGFAREFVVRWSLHPIQALGLLVPELWGDINLWGVRGFRASGIVPQGMTWFAGLYIGAIAVALVIAGIVSRRRLSLALGSWFALFAAFALGSWGPIYPLLLAVGVDFVRYPVKWLVPAMLPLALLAGLGLEALADETRSDKRLGPSLGAALGVLAALAAFVAALGLGLDKYFLSLAQVPGELPLPPDFLTEIRSDLSGSAARAAAPLLLLVVGIVFAKGRARRWIAPAAALLVAIDLLLANPPLAPTTSPHFYDTPAVVDAIRRDTGPAGRVRSEWFADTDPRWVRPPVTGVERYRWDRESLQMYSGVDDGLDLAFQSDTEGAAPYRYVWLGMLMSLAPQREQAMILGAAGVSHVVSLRRIDDARLVRVAEVPGRCTNPISVYRNRLFLPRARVVARAIAYDGDLGYVAAVRAGADDFFAHACLVEKDDARGFAPAAGEAGRAEILLDRGHFIRIRVTGGGGVLVLSDAFTPGWRATVDGRRETIVRADYAFRGVKIPAGEHLVEMSYSPWRR